MSYWKEYQLGELCEIRRGASPRPIHNYLGSQGMPWLKIADATNNRSRFISSTKECIKLEGVEKSVKVFPGDLILTNSATPGLPKFMKIEACIHDGWLLMRKFKGVLKEYLYYLLITERENLVYKSNGSVFNNLKISIVQNHKVIIPDLSTQTEIVEILSSLDELMEINIKMNLTLEAIAQAIFKEWFVDFRFPGFDGVLVDGLPTGWREDTLGENFNITMGQSPPGESYNNTGNGTAFFQGRTDFGFRFPENRMYTTSPNRLAKKLDTLVSVRAPVGDINMALKDCCIGRGLSSVRHNTGAYSYTYYAMKSLENIFKGFDGEGTIFGSINKTNFENISIVVPDELVIKRFEIVVNTLDKKILSNSKEIKTLTLLRDLLLPKLMTGKIKVA